MIHIVPMFHFSALRLSRKIEENYIHPVNIGFIKILQQDSARLYPY